MPTVTVEEMRRLVGQQSVSAWVEVDQAMIDRFAEATGDHQFIHVDPARAASTPFGGTIAHGFLTLSLLSRFALGIVDPPRLAATAMSVNYGLDKVRFLTPVRSGSRVRGRFTLIAFDEKRPGRYRQVNDCVVEIDGQDRPAMIARWIGQIFTHSTAV